jgi:hypothetical protein
MDHGSSFLQHFHASRINVPQFVSSQVLPLSAAKVHDGQVSKYFPHRGLAALLGHIFTSWSVESFTLLRLWLTINDILVREPLEKLDPDHLFFDYWEVILYTLALSFVLEGLPVRPRVVI